MISCPTGSDGNRRFSDPDHRHWIFSHPMRVASSCSLILEVKFGMEPKLTVTCEIVRRIIQNLGDVRKRSTGTFGTKKLKNQIKKQDFRLIEFDFIVILDVVASKLKYYNEGCS